MTRLPWIERRSPPCEVDAALARARPRGRKGSKDTGAMKGTHRNCSEAHKGIEQHPFGGAQDMTITRLLSFDGKARGAVGTAAASA